MRSVWFACCSCAEYAIVQREVQARDAAAHILRVRALSTLADVMGALPEQHAGVVIYTRPSQSSDVDRIVSTLCAADPVLSVVIVLDRLNPPYIARLFHAGASEVIVADGETHATENYSQACTEERADKSDACPAARDDRRSEGSAAEPEPDPKRLRDACAEAAPRDLALEELDCDIALGESEWPSDELSFDVGDRATSPRSATVYGSLTARSAQASDVRADTGPTQVLAERAVLDSSRCTDEIWRFQTSRAVSAPEVAPVPAAASPPAGQSGSDSASRAEGRLAPVVAAISGRGGCGKTTLVASMACCASQLGLRCAVLDLDLMFGNLYDLMGLEAASDLAALIPAAATGSLREEDIVRTSMRVCPGLSLWGPLAAPEQAELMHRPVEMLLGTLRRESDVILIDTSTFWGDAVAGAVAVSDRCLVVGDQTTSSPVSIKRAISLANSIGVPCTRMTCVINRFGSQMCKEDHAMRLEMAAALSSRARISDGGAEVPGMLSFGRVRELMERSGAYADSVRTFTQRTLTELGCRVERWADQAPAERRRRFNVRLPWAAARGRS